MYKLYNNKNTKKNEQKKKNIFYNNMVYKIECNKDGVIVHSRDNFASKDYKVKDDYAKIKNNCTIINYIIN